MMVVRGENQSRVAKRVPSARIELTTSSLLVTRSTTELGRLEVFLMTNPPNKLFIKRAL